MTNAPLRELIDQDGPFGGVSMGTAVRFQLGSRHYPPIHPDFDAPAIKAIQLCATGQVDEPVELPNGKVLTSGHICSELRLWDLVEYQVQADEEQD